MRCAGCELPGDGYAHTCAGSGTYVAAEAYDADAVAEIVAGWPYFNVSIDFKIRGVDEHMVREKLTPLVTALLEDDSVDSSEFTIQPEAVTA